MGSNSQGNVQFPCKRRCNTHYWEEKALLCLFSCECFGLLSSSLVGLCGSIHLEGKLFIRKIAREPYSQAVLILVLVSFIQDLCINTPFASQYLPQITNGFRIIL